MDKNISFKTQSSGGKATAIKLRKIAIDNYYKNPKICLECSKVITVKENQKVSDVRKKKFCSKQCFHKNMIGNSGGIQKEIKRNCFGCGKEVVVLNCIPLNKNVRCVDCKKKKS